MLYIHRNHWSGLLGTGSPGRSPRLTFTQLLSSARKIVLLHIFVYDLWFGQVTRGALRRRPKNNLSSVKRAQGAVRLPAVTPKLQAPACDMYPWPWLQPQLRTRISLATNCRSSNSVSTEINQQGVLWNKNLLCACSLSLPLFSLFIWRCEHAMFCVEILMYSVSLTHSCLCI